MTSSANAGERTAPIHQLLQEQHNGVLATASHKLDGWPFGSLTPFALNATGEPIVLLSALAEHTQNVLHDPRVSLFVQDHHHPENPQASARATLVCRAEPLPEAELATAQANYLQRFPQSAHLFQLGDFKLFKLKIERVRYIGGFGEMYWLARDSFMAPTAS